MYLLYCDESGEISNKSEKYFVLAGVAVFERQTHWIEQSLNKIAARFNADNPYSVELHASPMCGGKSGWRKIPRQQRLEAVADALQQNIAKRPCKGGSPRLFGIVLEKSQYSGRDIIGTAFEQLASRFDLFLSRLHRNDNEQRGLILFDKAKTEKPIQTLAREFKYSGHAYGRLRNYAEVPVFLDSKASRLIQLADLVAYALFRHYEHGDSQFFDIIKNCFDAEGSVQHGLCENP